MIALILIAVGFVITLFILGGLAVWFGMRQYATVVEETRDHDK